MTPDKWTPPKLRARPFINPSAWAIITDETPPVKVCELSDFASHSKNYADLFAAAPDLLAAVEKAIDTIYDWYTMPHAGSMPQSEEMKAESWRLYQNSPEMKMLHAAVAKARGETPDAK
jgi:hypothetical protein